jgi:hypothetical protein
MIAKLRRRQRRTACRFARDCQDEISSHGVNQSKRFSNLNRMEPKQIALGGVEFRFMPDSMFQFVKLRYRGYSVYVDGAEIAFVCVRDGCRALSGRRDGWHVFRPGDTEKAGTFSTRSAAIASLITA